jgi:putative ABC transport system permease protein
MPAMWTLTLRDLQWRRRRFLVAVLATALVFTIALLLSGVSASLFNEIDRTVELFEADAWVVPESTSGPFTAAGAFPGPAASGIRTWPGVRTAVPLAITRSTVEGEDVNVIGYGNGFSMKVASGAMPDGPGQVVADGRLGVGVGEKFRMADHEWTVVGLVHGITYFGGIPSVIGRLPDVQAAMVSGLDLVTAVRLEGAPTEVPAGWRALDNRAVRADLARPLANATQSIDFIRVLLWIVAAGIIGSIVYLSALERVRDFAVLKATGTTTASMASGLAVQAVLLAAAAALAASVAATLAVPAFPLAARSRSVGVRICRCRCSRW